MIINPPQKIVIHCSDSRNGIPVSVETIDKWHKANGWSGIGYHAILQPDGTIDPGRIMVKNNKFNPGAHVSGANSDSIGVCLIGRDKFTLKQFQSLFRLIKSYQDAFNIKTHDIYGHYEFESAIKQQKRCPNIRATDLVVAYFFNDPTILSKYTMEV